ncbi:MAG TPA: redoxin domain-containing protein [Humidesulfovibrio sp.]|uniref:redoxin domain-containing protein n=1 Tax=Humidesulfovibrio sp. TaxID=2910988 RepID=UPI002CD35D39|nr:redoxin domain-containing protein [Humidesulfovibrio sp.]HWR02873.1 redoxin domain-containing protein [Humidesulfovibrio sp.]
MKTRSQAPLLSFIFAALLGLAVLATAFPSATAQALDMKDIILDPGPLKPVDSTLKVRPGQQAPDFTLPGFILGQGGKRLVHLSDYRGRKNVMLSFVPAAFTPVCSDQWPGYNLAKDLFDEYDTVVLGISEDNLPSQFAWAVEMRGLWFPVLSDFNPHGAVASLYGVLRGDGTAERAIIIIDKKGVVRFAQSFNINIRPDLEIIMRELHKIEEGAPDTFNQGRR